MTNRLIELHATALDLADGHVAAVRPLDPTRPTPCAGWSLGNLLAHMIGQHLGFAQAVRELAAPAAAYRPVPFDTAAWAESVRELRVAFAGADLGASAVAVELGPVPLPVSRLVAAQLLDTVVHTWDIAESIGVGFTPPEDVLAATAEIAAGIPDQAFGPGRAFAARLPAGGDAWQRTLALVGRRAGASLTPAEG